MSTVEKYNVDDFESDPDLPVLEVFTPTDGETVRSEYIEIAGFAFSPIIEQPEVLISVNGSRFMRAGYMSEYDFSLSVRLISGMNSIIVKTEDESGVAEVTLNVVFDLNPPFFRNVRLIKSGEEGSASYAIEAEVSQGDIISVYGEINGRDVTFEKSQDKWIFNLNPGFINSIYRCRLNVRNAAGSVSHWSGVLSGSKGICRFDFLGFDKRLEFIKECYHDE